MKLSELEEALSKLKLSYRNYGLRGGYLEDGVCISKNENYWEVYYCERGKKTQIGKFQSEDDACEFLFSKFKKESDAERWL